MKRKNLLGRVLAAGLAAGILMGGTTGGVLQPTYVQASITEGADLVDGLDRSPNYYIVPDSSQKEISEEFLSGLTDTERQMAINEIYARHGRRFVIPEVQDYFNEKAWYLGTVAADSFDVNVFSSVEEKNIEKLARKLHYLLPGSDLRYVTDAEVDALTKEEQQLAINEIYARRGRRFDRKEYQDYFDSQPWYYGTIAPADFDEDVFNDYENTNISKLSGAMKNGNSEVVSGFGSADSSVYTDFAGEYHLYTESKEVMMQISVYSDRPIADASEGTECGTVHIASFYPDGAMAYMDGYLMKKNGNNYVLSGKGMNGLTVTVGEDSITVGNSRSINGTYEKTESYYS